MLSVTKSYENCLDEDVESLQKRGHKIKKIIPYICTEYDGNDRLEIWTEFMILYEQ